MGSYGPPFVSRATPATINSVGFVIPHVFMGVSHYYEPDYPGPAREPRHAHPGDQGPRNGAGPGQARGRPPVDLGGQQLWQARPLGLLRLRRPPPPPPRAPLPPPAAPLTRIVRSPAGERYSLYAAHAHGARPRLPPSQVPFRDLAIRPN